MLLQLQTHLRQKNRASLQEISQQLHMDVNALREMLNQLVRKGRVQEVVPQTKDNKCSH